MVTLPRLVLGGFFATTIAALACGAGVSTPDDLQDGLTLTAPARAGIDVGRLARLEEAVARGDYPKTTSILISRNAALVYEAYFGDGNRELLNDTRSATKSITSLATGVAIADGALPSERALALRYLADLRPFQNDTADKEAITIEDLLTMSSALDCNDDDDKSPGNEDNMHPQPNWTRWAVDLPTMQGYRRDSHSLGPWRYCTTGAFLLGQILQRATGEPVDRYIEQRILEPLGITQREWPRSPSHEAMTGGGLRLRSRDLVKIAMMVTDHGRWHGRQIVPESWIGSALTVRRAAYAGANYGYLFWQREYATPCGRVSGWYMAGNGGNAIVVLEPLHAAIVVTRTNYNARGMHQQTAEILERYIVPALGCTQR